MSDNESNNQSQMSVEASNQLSSNRRPKHSSKVPKQKTILQAVNDTKSNAHGNAAINSAPNKSPANNRTGQQAPKASSTGSLNSGNSLGELNPNDFYANIATMLDTKFREMTNRLDEHECIIQDKVEAQNERIDELENHITDLTNAFNTLHQDFDLYRNQLVQPAQAGPANNNVLKKRLLYGNTFNFKLFKYVFYWLIYIMINNIVIIQIIIFLFNII